MKNFLLVCSLFISLLNSSDATKLEYRNGWLKDSGMDILLISDKQDYSSVINFLREQKEALEDKIEQDDLDDLFCLILAEHGEEVNDKDWNITYEDSEQPVMNVEKTVKYLNYVLDDNNQGELEKILRKIKDNYSQNVQQDGISVKEKKMEIIDDDDISPIDKTQDELVERTVVNTIVDDTLINTTAEVNGSMLQYNSGEVSKTESSHTKMPKAIKPSKEEIEKIEHKKAKVGINSQNIGNKDKASKGERKKKRVESPE